MVEDRVERRLAAIFTADVVGYSRLVRANEEDALAAVGALISDVIQPAVAEHRGRIFKKMGDSVLAEFGSTVDAVRCAIAVQQEIADRGAGIAPERQIAFRIGLHVGDVVVDGDDIHGDGVNVAARIEGLAAANGICISEDVLRQVEGRIATGFEDLGPQRLKNINSPIRVYRVRPDADRQGRVFMPVATRLRRLKWPAAAFITVIVALALAWQFGVFPIREVAPKFDPASIERMAFPLPDKPSIAVLPFKNMSGDAEQEYFVDGMTEDIITDLSKLSGLFVIARNSTFTYKGKAVKVQQVAEELGVRYVLEGSVRRAGDQVRINAQLVDATTGGHLWAERYDGAMTDIFKLQDRVTQQIVAALSVTLSAGERALAEQLETSVPEAYDAFLAGWRHFRLRTVEDHRKALIWLEKAVTLDPDYGRAWAALASLYLTAYQRDWLGELGIDYTRQQDLLDKAMRRPTPLAYRVRAEMLMSASRFDDANTVLDKASALDPNDPDTYVLRATLVSVQGDTDTAIALMKTAMRLNPHYPAFILSGLGAHYLRAGDAAKAIEFLERAPARNPGDWVSLVYLTVAYAQADRLEDSAQTAKDLVERRKELGFSVTLTGSFDNWFVFKGAYGETVRQGLRKAGLQDRARPVDLNLSPENRLSGAELREDLKTGFRNKGKLPAGMWVRDMDPVGNGVHYWQGIQTATSTSEIRGATQYTKRSNGMEQTCNFYRNPKGTKENLDEFIAVCSNGVFPYARFPLPEAAR
jgi:TolB-like protein/class 3 adenylate cyclase